MNGANTEPSAKTISEPNNTKKMIIGANHHFLRCFIKSNNSAKIESFDIFAPHY